MNEKYNYMPYKTFEIRELPPQKDCLFCNLDPSLIINKFHHCFAIYDKFPVSPGHTLIIPFQHTENWFTASEEIKLDMLQAMEHMKQLIDERFSPDGYNIGINNGIAAGQTVFHLHMHLIPRYANDMGNPRGGVRGVIPEKQQY